MFCAECIEVVSKLMVTRRVSEGTSEGPLDERINLCCQFRTSRLRLPHGCFDLRFVVARRAWNRSDTTGASPRRFVRALPMQSMKKAPRANSEGWTLSNR